MDQFLHNNKIIFMLELIKLNYFFDEKHNYLFISIVHNLI